MNVFNSGTTVVTVGLSVLVGSLRQGNIVNCMCLSYVLVWDGGDGETDL